MIGGFNLNRSTQEDLVAVLEDIMEFHGRNMPAHIRDARNLLIQRARAALDQDDWTLGPDEPTPAFRGRHMEY